MTTLLIDGLIALVKLIDRGMTAVEKNVSHRAAPDDSQPAGAGEILPPNPGTGGNPHRSTSELLDVAASYVRAYRGAVVHVAHGPFLELVDELVDELRDRSAQFAAYGD